MTKLIFQARIKTRLGSLLAVASSQGLCGLEFDAEARLEAVRRRVSRKYSHHQWAKKSNLHLDATENWLQKYFKGDFGSLGVVPLDLIGSEFERKVWAALLDIPFGKLSTYGELAGVIRYRGAARAVGSAVGRNPVGIIVPCHRIVGKNHSLTGYGGGLDRKQWLLSHEGFGVPGNSSRTLVGHSDARAFGGLS